ncbi:MAG: hypothetical protein ACE5K2_06990 [Candidatus Zixiibacteriota bacterium]
MPNVPLNFDKNIFINCPFDKDYIPLLKALLFTIMDCGLNPRIASERFDSGEERFKKIRELIKESRYSIHDLSRMEPLKSKDFPRFNMPFELGLDLGGRYFGPEPLTRKRCLVLERERYRFQKVLSDVAGSDIREHNSDPETLVRGVRNWIFGNVKKGIRSGTKIWQRYNEFLFSFESSVKRMGFTKKDIDEMPVVEFIYFIKSWIEQNP